MSQEPPKGKSLLAPIATRYKPSQADFERLSAKIDASLAAGSTSTTSPSAAPHLAWWVGLSCVALLAAGVIALHSRESPAADVTYTPASPPAMVDEKKIESASADPIGVPVVSVDSLPQVTPRATLPAGTIRAAGPSKPSLADDTLAREARLLAEAESAFRRGEDARALSFLDEHAREFPDGVLKDERIAERIVVLCHAGRVDQAVREGQAFLQNRGSDPLARRVVMSCAGSPTTTTETP